MSRRRLIVFAVLGCFILAMLGVFGVLSEWSRQRQENRAAAAEIFDRIALGQSDEDVRSLIVESAKSKPIELREHRANVWLIDTPLEFGANNWQVWLVFTDRKLTASGIRLLDGLTLKPVASADDKISDVGQGTLQEILFREFRRSNDRG
ncbi:MAG: hypothetical protein ACRC1K_21165 [Planctomycetia bacterium]